jgi:hypothetical protein
MRRFGRQPFFVINDLKAYLLEMKNRTTFEIAKHQVLISKVARITMKTVNP